MPLYTFLSNVCGLLSDFWSFHSRIEITDAELKELKGGNADRRQS
jgi:hypothetical protein